MAFSKSKLYPESDQITCTYFHSLSHPARLKLLEQLHEFGPSPVQKLNALHPIKQPTLSGHLEFLREARLVDFNEKFPYTLYNLDLKRLEHAHEKFEAFFQKFIK